jgi:mercuric ion transport protein
METRSREPRQIMNDKKLLRTGIIGAVVIALCCVTPLLVIPLVAIGLSAWVGWLDYVLFPALALFLGLTIYAVVRIGRRRA